jgi:serine phosphatase RsbU (regulator of sigma subunit)/anti-sigma regulatory factor (Ser/Thr protein kinase)
MARRIPKEIILTFKSRDDFLPEIRTQVQNACVDAGINPKITMAILLAIEEACSNVIRHAYLFQEGIIRLVINVESDRITFTLVDTGRGFEFSQDEIPDLVKYVETGRKGGLGLYLIRKVMDEVDYGQVKGENHLRMVKYTRGIRKKRRIKAASGKGKISFRTRFSLTAAAAVMLIIGAIFLYLNVRILKNTRVEIYNENLSLLEGLAAQLADKMTLHDELELATLVSKTAQNSPHFDDITVIDTTGTIWADARDEELLLTGFRFPPALDGSERKTGFEKTREYFTYLDSLQNQIHMVVVPIEHLGITRGAVIARFPETVIASAIRKEQISLLYISLGSLVVAFILIYFIAQQFARPVRKLSDSVTRMKKGDVLQSRVNLRGGDELAEIAQAFNEMTRRFKEQQKILLKKERLRAEMSTAWDIQQALLPKRFPDVPGYEIATIYKPTQNVSGDYFDFVKVDDKHLGVVVADVSGGGVPGSLVMTMLRTAIRLEARKELSPGKVLQKVNSLVSEDIRRGMFITVFYAILDAENRIAEFSSAGHNPMILYRPSEKDCFLFNPSGVPVGLQWYVRPGLGGKLESRKVRLQYNDLLVFYTDGITESRNSAGEMFGEERLVDFIRRNGELSPRDFVVRFEKELKEFVGGSEQDDDITLVVIREKTDADAVDLKKKIDIFNSVDAGILSEEEALKLSGLSRPEFDDYFDRWKTDGSDGLVEYILRTSNNGDKMISFSQSIWIRNMIIKDPGLDPEQLYSRMKKEIHGDGITFHAFEDELRRLHLESRIKRFQYSIRHDPQGKNESPVQPDSTPVDSRAKKTENRREILKKLMNEDLIAEKPLIPDSLDIDIIRKDQVVDILQKLDNIFGQNEIKELSKKIIARLEENGDILNFDDSEK